MKNVRIAIRDSTDSHNVAFFDNVAGIKYKKAEIQRFLAGSASILTLKYNSKDIDSIRSGCKLAFRYKARDYWLNIMKFEKQGFEVEITACSLHLEMNNEERGAHKPDKAMSFAEYLAYYDPEHSVTLGINQVSDKKIKLEWTGTDTILARLFSIANSFDAELEFVTELNDDYSLKRHVLNVYKKGNLGSNKTSSPVRVGKELKVINYSDSIEDLRTAVRATGKDGLTIDGLNKKIYDDNKELLYYSSGMTVYAPQSRDRFPSVGKGSNDNWIVEDLGETQYETKEALWGYMYGEIQKKSLPEITYEVEGAIEAGIGDTQTLIDDIHFEPALYVQARVSELEDDILTGKVTNSTFINFERKYSQIADSLLRQVEALAEDAAPYIVRLTTDNGYNFKNGQGTSTITAKLEKYSKIVNASWKWLINNSIVSDKNSVTINASQVMGTLNVVAVASVDGNEVAREYITFTNSDDGVGIKSIKRYYTTNDQAEGVTAGGQNWSTKPTTVTVDKSYMWSYDVITYTNDTSLVTEPAVIGARGDDGLDADTTGITEALDKAKQELTALSANIEKVRDDSLAAVNEAKQQLTTVANDLNTAKTDLQNAVSAVDTKATNLQTDLAKTKQDLSTVQTNLQNSIDSVDSKATALDSDLTKAKADIVSQAKKQTELNTKLTTVETTANGTKTTVSQLSKTVDSLSGDVSTAQQSIKKVEDDVSGVYTTLSTLTVGGGNLLSDTTDFSMGKWQYTVGNSVDNNAYSIVDGAFHVDSTIAVWHQWQTYSPEGTSSTRKAVSPALANLKAGQPYILSFEARCLSGEAIVWAELRENLTTGTNPARIASHSFTITDDWVRYSFSTDSLVIDENHDYWRVILGYNKIGSVEFRKVKLEEATVASPWTPAYSDSSIELAEYKQGVSSQLTSLSRKTETLENTLASNKVEIETTVNGIKTDISELQAYKDDEGVRAESYLTASRNETAKQITAERSVTAKNYVATSKYTEDVNGIKASLAETKSTADSASSKAATLETGLNGLSAKFETLKIGSRNYFKNSKSRKYYINSTEIQDVRTYIDDDFWKNDTRLTKDYVRMSFDIAFNPALPSNFTTNVHFSTSPWYNCGGITFKGGTTALQHFDLKFDLSGAGNSYKTDNVFIRLNNTLPLNTAVSLENFNLYLSAVVEDYSQNEADLDQKVAEYKQTADQNYASLQSTVQNLDGTVQQNKTTADQTAQGFKTRIESLETYKDGETTRASQYFELAKTETARQLTAERTAIAKDYVAKSTYTSDVTGIKNELSATTTTANTTKTNLANYQTSNDKAVASLQSSLKTTDGNVSSLQTKVTAVPGQITSAVSAVEGKIPTNVSTRNLILKSNDLTNPHKQSGANTTVTSTDSYFVIKSTGYTANAYGGMSWNMSISEVKAGEEFSILMPVYIDSSGSLDNGLAFVIKNHSSNSVAYNYNIPTDKKDQWFNVAISFKATKDVVFDTYPFYVYLVKNGLVRIKPPMLVRGNLIPSDYQPAFEDTESDITKLSSELTQTKDGMTLLATKTELNSTKNELQSGITTATDKANAAQSTAASNSQAISTHTTQISALNTGLSAKVSQTDFNSLSGRVTTAENNITANANELSSKITSVEGKIPSGEMNLVKYGRLVDGYSPYNNVEYSTHPFYYNSAYKMYIIKNTATSEKILSMNRFKVERNTDYTLYFKGFNNDAITHMDVLFLKRVNGSTNDFDSAQILVNSRKLSTSKAEDVSVTFNTGNYDEGYIRFDNNGSTTAGTQADLYFGDVSVKKGKSNNGWSPSLAELASSQDLKIAQSEIKQTTDAITASVSSVQTAASNAQSTANTAVSKADTAQAGVNTLDSTTVKSASLTINTDGIIMKAGKSTTDVANAIGSYFAVNQNAINLFSDKINVKGSMIVDGAITSTKIAAGAITADKIQAGSITADMFKGNQITSLNGATTLNLYTGEIIFNNQYATINQIKGSYKSQISLSSVDYKAVNESAWSSVNMLAFNSTKLTSATRRAGSAVDMFSKFSLMTLYGEKIAFTGETSGIPNSQNAIIVNTNSDDVNFTNSQTNSSEGAWNYSMIMDFGANAAISAPDIKLAGHFKSLTGILDDLCKKVGVMWI
ncbi:Chromosome partition protein Smc [Streptococcus infantarius subsp. infantarius]|nr:Chromosome partition protein Smc [Streptococcus infantarius subsp. infantarius]